MLPGVKGVRQMMSAVTRHSSTHEHCSRRDHFGDDVSTRTTNFILTESCRNYCVRKVMRPPFCSIIFQTHEHKTNEEKEMVISDTYWPWLEQAPKFVASVSIRPQYFNVVAQKVVCKKADTVGIF